MKKIILILLLAASGSLYAAPVVDEKVLTTFKAAFPKADQITWYEDGDNFLVYFTNNEIKCRMWYDAGGSVQKTIRYYYEQNLCPFILTKVKQNYPDKTVYCVTEVSSDEGITYSIVLEDQKKWYHLSVDNYGRLRMDKNILKREPSLYSLFIGKQK